MFVFQIPNELCNFSHPVQWVKYDVIVDDFNVIITAEFEGVILVNQLLISEMKDAVIVGDIEENIHHFKSAFELIVAAGGVVYNSSGEILFIYRKKKWDLPKGKLDEGEDIPTCAIREVMEETGIKAVSIVRPLCNTYHLYIDGDMKLKEVFWFVMQTQHRTLHPQHAEEIQKAVWVNRGNIHIQLYKSYETISDIFMLL